MEAAPIITHCCHCRSCQRVSGSAFRINAMIETDRLTVLQGAPEPYRGAGSLKVVQCPACRFGLWSHQPQLGEGIAFVGVGALDEGERLQPEAHYFIRSKHPWVTLPPEVRPSSSSATRARPASRERVMVVLAAAGRQRQGASSRRDPLADRSRSTLPDLGRRRLGESCDSARSGARSWFQLPERVRGR